MRYVMVWFTCSVEGCEARTEHLVAARQQTPNSPVWFNGDDLPDGWSAVRLHNVKFEGLRDRQHTYCPEHAEPGYVEPAELSATEADHVYISNGILSVDEVRDSRFKP